jgi:hypothetical protein
LKRKKWLDTLKEIEKKEEEKKQEQREEDRDKRSCHLTTSNESDSDTVNNNSRHNGAGDPRHTDFSSISG